MSVPARSTKWFRYPLTSAALNVWACSAQEVACGIRVGGFMGQQRPPGGLASLDVAVCTIEKANGLVNRMLQEGTLAQLGACGRPPNKQKKK